MGIPRGAARLLLEEHRRRPFSGRLLQLGRSSVYFTRRELEGWARRHEVELAPGVATELSHDPRLAAQGCLSDRTFFRLLGFDSAEACDIAEWEGAEHIVDLNRPVPEALRGGFDVVFETGTSIQVFDLPEVLRNVRRLLRPGGRAVHAAVPSNNHVDLGFVMACPTLFADWYAAAGDVVDSLLLCEVAPYWHRGRLHSAPWRIYRYEPGCLDHLSYGRYGGRQLAVFCVATRGDGDDDRPIPQLGQYRESWRHWQGQQERQSDAPSAGDRPAGAESRGGLARRADALFAHLPWLDRAYLPFKRWKERLHRLGPRRMPPLVARY